jgi:hypothetical protein
LSDGTALLESNCCALATLWPKAFAGTMRRLPYQKASAMRVELITNRNELVIRRLVLDPGEAMFWHKDNCHRFSVVVRGSRLAIEYKDSGEIVEFEVFPGMTGWDAPEQRAHRAINRGSDTYEEVVTFYRSSSDLDPQPIINNDDAV